MSHPRHLVIASVAALAVGVLPSCGGDDGAPEPVIRPVRYEPIYSTGGQRTRAFSGVARAGVKSDLSFKVAGTVERVTVDVGDEVTAGQLLAELDPQDYELRAQQAAASLEQARAAARNARASYDRIRALYEEGNASPNDLDQARAGSESADAQVAASEKQHELARRQLTYTRLTAPVAGSIADVRVEVNENVTAGRTVFVLTAGERFEVEVGMPEVLITQVHQGDKVEIRFDAIPDEHFPGTVAEVGVAPTGTATTFPVTVVLDRRDERSRPGMAAEVTFRFTSTDNRERYLVPSVAVGEDRNGRFAFVVEKTADDLGVVHRRDVEVGELTSDGLEIFEGLTDGDLLVTAGVNHLNEGMTVRLLGVEGAGQ